MDDSASALISEDFPTLDRPKKIKHLRTWNLISPWGTSALYYKLPTNATSGTETSGMDVDTFAPAKNCNMGNYAYMLVMCSSLLDAVTTYFVLRFRCLLLLVLVLALGRNFPNRSISSCPSQFPKAQLFEFGEYTWWWLKSIKLLPIWQCRQLFGLRCKWSC